MNKNIFKNAFTGFCGQFIILLLGLIVPRIIIVNYGSDANGVLSTITQIFTYMALLESGIGQAAKNLLYKPIKDKNTNEVSRIYCISQKYYKKITLFYFLGVMISSILVPFLLKSDLDFITISLICFFQGAAGALSFYFIQTQSIVLAVDGKSYINNTINLINQILSYIIKILMAIIGMNIAFIQFIYFIITILKVLFYKRYFKKHYGWLKKDIIVNDEKLKDRNAFIITEIAWTIFSSTDMIILSIFIGAKLSSVYSVYNMIFVSINALINSIYLSINYVLGTTYHDDINKYKTLHDIFNSVFMSIIVVLMICTYLLIIPFIKLYTNGINDINYIYESLPLLFCLVQILSWSRYVSGNLTCLAGYAKLTSYISLIEAITNIILSIIFVKFYGIVGVLLATVIALPIKVIFCNYISDKKIMKRDCYNTIKILGCNYIIFTIAVIVIKYININITNYTTFLIYGFLAFVISSIITIGINYLCNKKMIDILKIRKVGE